MNHIRFSSKSRTVIVVLPVILLSLLMTAQSIHFPLSHRMDCSDSSVYQYLGHLITIGKTPYIDGFDHKGPLLYLINALGLIIQPDWGIWLLDFLFAIGCGLFFYHTAFSIMKKHLTSGFIALVVLSGLGYSYWIGNTPDYYSMFFLAMAFDCVVDFQCEKGLKSRKVFLCGIAVAAVFWLKANMVGGIAVFCLCIVAYELYKKRYNYCLRYAAFATLGFVCASIAILGYYLWNHAFSSMFYDYFVFSKEYITYFRTLFSSNESYLYFSRHPIVLLSMVSVILYLVLLLKKYKSQDNREMDLFMLFSVFAFIISLILVIMPGSCFEHYEALLYSPILLELCAFYEIASKLLETKIAVKLLNLSVLIAMCCCIYFNCSYAVSQYKLNWSEDTMQTTAIQYIKEHSSSSDEITVLSPYLCGLYLASGRESATDAPYVQGCYDDINRGGVDHNYNFWTEYAEQIINNQPKIIIYDLSFSDEILENTKMAEVLPLYTEALSTESYRIYLRN